MTCFAVCHRAHTRWNLDLPVVGLLNTLQLQSPALADESRWCAGVTGIRIPRSPSLFIYDHIPSSVTQALTSLENSLTDTTPIVPRRVTLF